MMSLPVACPIVERDDLLAANHHTHLDPRTGFGNLGLGFGGKYNWGLADGCTGDHHWDHWRISDQMAGAANSPSGSGATS